MAGLLISTSTLGADEVQPPPNLVLQFGALARPIWESYHIGGEFDLELFITDHLNLGSIHDGDCETFLAWSLMQIEEDPQPVLEALLDSKDPKKVGFALYTIWFLGDRRFYHRVVELTRSTLKLPSSWNFIAVSTMAELMKDSFEAPVGRDGQKTREKNDDLSNRILSKPASWYVENVLKPEGVKEE